MHKKELLDLPANDDPFERIYVLCRSGRYSRAQSLMVDAAGKLRASFTHDRNQAWYCLGDILFRRKKFREALLGFKRALHSAPEDVEAMMAIGNCYSELNRPRYAERYFRRALLGITPPNSNLRYDVTFNLANALFDQKKMVEASILYKKLLRAPVEIRELAAKNLLLTQPKNIK